MPKKNYHIVKATTRDMQPKLDGELFPLPASGSVTTTDKGIADELNQVYGNKGTGELVVAEQPYTGLGGEDNGHTYFFAPSKKLLDVYTKRHGKTTLRERLKADPTMEEYAPGKWRKKK